MSHINDLKYEALIASGFTGHISEMMLQWAQSYGATANQTNDAILEALILAGATSENIPDAWFEVLGNLGHTGTINDMLNEFWSYGGGLLNGATFDGTNDYLSYGSDFTGLSDGTQIIIATRIRVAVDSVNQYIFDTVNGRVTISISSGNAIIIATKTSAGATLNILSSSSTVTANGYVNILSCIDTSIAGAADSYIYLDDSDVTTKLVTNTGIVDFTDPSFFVGTKADLSGKFNGDINFLYINMGEHLDFSVEANRRKFFNAQGVPILNPNGDGSEVTGTAPSVYLAGDYQQWHNNKSGNGGFTVTGALDRPLP